MSNNRSSNGKKIAVALILIAIIGGIVYMGVMNATETEATDGIPRNAVTVQWDNPHRQTIISSVSARGTVELIHTATIFPETQAQIQRLYVEVGDVVEIGDLLITYDASILDTLNDRLAEARLALRSAELALQATRIAPSGTEIMAAEAQIDQARNQRASVEAQLQQIDLNISQIQVNIQTAQNHRNNVQSLFNNGIATRTELDNAENSVRQLEDQLAITQAQRNAQELGIPLAEESERLAIAQLDALRNRNNQPAAVNQAQLQEVNVAQARLRIEQIQRDIDSFIHEERATAAGTILSMTVREGGFSVTGQPLMEIADTTSNNLLITVHVPENDAGHIEVGQEAEISGGALGGHTYMGYISRIHPIAAPRQMGTSVETVLTVEVTPGETARLRPGYTVDAAVVTNISEYAIVVPLMSTLSIGGNNFVYVITEESLAERRYITIGEHTGMYVAATGVDENDRIISNPINIHDGMPVRPVSR